MGFALNIIRPLTDKELTFITRILFFEVSQEKNQLKYMYLLTTMQHSHRRVFFHKGINKSPLKYRQIPAKSLPLHLQLQHSQHKEAL